MAKKKKTRPLNADEIQMIVVDYLNGSKQRVKSQKAEEFLKKLIPEIAAVEKKGGVVDVPPEWEVDTEGKTT
jgi:hypothetical protein